MRMAGYHKKAEIKIADSNGLPGPAKITDYPPVERVPSAGQLDTLSLAGWRCYPRISP
jgi:hypothetical protein